MPHATYTAMIYSLKLFLIQGRFTKIDFKIMSPSALCILVYILLALAMVNYYQTNYQLIQ